MADSMSALSPVNTLPTESEWNTMAAMAQQLVPTGFLPKAVDTPQKAVAIVLKGRELGIPPMYALSNITVINGKPTANAELMLALVKRAYGRNVIWVEKSTPEIAVIGYLVHNKPKFYEFTIQMAQKAGLMSNQTWTKYPDAMLRARAISAVCRMEFPEVIGGMYVPGELGEPVQVDEQTGEVTSVDYEAPTIVTNEAEAFNKAMKRLHAVAANHGITHDDLHLHALKLGRKSLNEFDADVLAKTADAIESRPERARAYYEQLRVESAGSGDSETLEAEYQEVDPDTGEVIPAHVGRGGQGTLIDLPTNADRFTN